VLVDAESAQPRRVRPTGRRRALPIVLAAVAAAVLVALAAGFAYLSSLPGTGDAEARVRRILAEHRGTPGVMPPPAKLGTAVVAVEDEHFYSNVAVNILDGAGRAALAALQTSADPGGSTIGQQLAKTLYPHGEGVGGTLEEIGLAVRLSLRYSKPRILNMYLNSVYYGHGYWGEVAAAHGYFGRSPRQLSWAQAALLAGLPQAPSAYDPERHLALARHRQAHVVDQLVDNHYLSPAEGRAVMREPLRLRRSGTRPAPPGARPAAAGARA
jgi:penicillin-binding protein 1A